MFMLVLFGSLQEETSHLRKSSVHERILGPKWPASLMEREPRIGSAPREDHLDGLRHPDGGVKERVRKCEEYCMSNIVE